MMHECSLRELAHLLRLHVSIILIIRGCSVLTEELTRAAFMHHDNKGHSTLKHNPAFKGLPEDGDLRSALFTKYEYVNPIQPLLHISLMAVVMSYGHFHEDQQCHLTCMNKTYKTLCVIRI